MFGKMILAFLFVGAALAQFAAAASFKAPDLTVSINVTNNTFTMGVPRQVLVTTKNIGYGMANSSNGSVTSFGYSGGITQYVGVPPLPANGVYYSWMTVTCTQPGGFALYANADFYNMVVESNEINNGVKASGNCIAGNSSNGTAPDLVIDHFSLSSTNFTINTPTQVLVWTKNVGTGSAGASTTRLIYQSTLLTEPVPALSPGASQWSSFMVTCTQLGGFVLNATADAFGVVSESNENNNKLMAIVNCIAGNSSNSSMPGVGKNAEPKTVVVPAKGTSDDDSSEVANAFVGAKPSSVFRAPDLTASVNVTNSTFVMGVPRQVLVTTKNIGYGMANSSNGSVTSFAYSGGSVQYVPVPNLPANGVYYSWMAVTCTQPGPFALYANADYYQMVAESNEANNGMKTSGNCVGGNSSNDSIRTGGQKVNSVLVPVKNQFRPSEIANAFVDTEENTYLKAMNVLGVYLEKQ